jgi:hypothetical protein
VTADAEFLVEDSSEGRTLVLTGGSTDAAAEVLARGVDTLTVNYARGFSGGNLEFLEAWSIRRLNVLDRGIGDLSPIARLAGSLEELSVQAAPRAELDLGCRGCDRWPENGDCCAPRWARSVSSRA